MRLPGAGARGVARAVRRMEPEALPPYSPDWAERGGEETLLKAARRWLVQIPVREARAGDVLLFRMSAGVPVKHCGIVGSEWRRPGGGADPDPRLLGPGGDRELDGRLVDAAGGGGVRVAGDGSEDPLWCRSGLLRSLLRRPLPGRRLERLMAQVILGGIGGAVGGGLGRRHRGVRGGVAGPAGGVFAGRAAPARAAAGDAEGAVVGGRGAHGLRVRAGAGDRPGDLGRAVSGEAQRAQRRQGRAAHGGLRLFPELRGGPVRGAHRRGGAGVGGRAAAGPVGRGDAGAPGDRGPERPTR